MHHFEPFRYLARKLEHVVELAGNPRLIPELLHSDFIKQHKDLSCSPKELC